MSDSLKKSILLYHMTYPGKGKKIERLISLDCCQQLPKYLETYSLLKMTIKDIH